MTDTDPALRARYDDIISRLDEPKMGNPKYGMDRRAIEGELRSLTLTAAGSSRRSATSAPTPELPAIRQPRSDQRAEFAGDRLGSMDQRGRARHRVRQ
jgi:hypothetical protein